MQKIYSKINKEEKSDIIIFDCYIEQKNKQIKNKFYINDGILNKKDIEEIQLQNIGKGETKYFPNECNISVVWAKLYKKEFIIKNKLIFKEKIKRTPDTIFNIYAFEKAKNISHYNIYGYHYRKNKDSITHNFDQNIKNDIIIFLEEVKKYIKEFNKNKRFINTYYIAILVKLIQIYEIYINNKKIDELKKFLESEQYTKYIKEIANIPKNKINLYQKLMLKNMKNKSINKAKILIKVKNVIK